MDYITKIGVRTYVFHSLGDKQKAWSVYLSSRIPESTKDILAFEDKMENSGIDFEYSY